MRRRYSWIRNLLGEVLGFHSQNLNDKPGGIKGHWLRHSRFWIRIPRPYLEANENRPGLLHSNVRWATPYTNNEICLEFGWDLWSSSFRIDFSVSDDPGPSFSIAFPPVSFYVSMGGIFPYKWCVKWDWYDTSLRIFDWGIWINVWANDSETDYTVPWWKRRKFVWHPVDTFLGSTSHSRKALSSRVAVEVPMPERSYKGHVEIFESTWKRKRWPWPKKVVRAEIDMNDDPIPCPGKGENAWDCGEDATYSLTCQETTITAAVAAIQKTVMRTRERHGSGMSWRPEPKKEAASV